MRVWKVPSSAHWDAGGARTLDELLTQGQGAGFKPETPAANERGRGGYGGKATVKQKQKKRKRRDIGGEDEEESETVAVKKEVQ